MAGILSLIREKNRRVVYMGFDKEDIVICEMLEYVELTKMTGIKRKIISLMWDEGSRFGKSGTIARCSTEYCLMKLIHAPYAGQLWESDMDDLSYIVFIPEKTPDWIKTRLCMGVFERLGTWLVRIVEKRVRW